ncbi:MAG TPA: response regulator [Nitrososphaeraceae archaeon]|nr:response regulator [Nitrososphaeraceae archaeon]
MMLIDSSNCSILLRALNIRIKDNEQCVLVDVISRNAKRLQQLTEDILNVTRIESQSLSLKKEIFNLNEIVMSIEVKLGAKLEEEELLLSPFAKRILIIDDDTDIIFTFKKGLEAENSNKNNKTFFKVYTYNDPLEALSQFKPNFYDLLLVDINMPEMNGFELSTKILELDINVRIYFMSSGLINQEALDWMFYQKTSYNRVFG